MAAGLRTPANVGGILRLCDAANARLALFVDVEHSDARSIKRLSRHASASVRHRFMTFEQFSREAGAIGTLVALEVTTRSTNLFEADLPRDPVFVVGNERHGVPPGILNLCAMATHIPMHGVNTSLNVATALAIALYEWRRRYAEHNSATR